MVRGKKKESAMTPEEKRAQALVPDWEWPYKVPENWLWTKAGHLVTMHRGVSYKKDDAHTEKGENDCLVMRGGNILEGEIDTDADNVYVDKSLVSEEQLVRKHDIIIVSSTGSTKVIGRAGISSADYDDVAFGAFLTLLRPVDQVSKPFVDYYFQSDLYRERIRSLASGVNINNIRAEYITESPMPVPPLAEQQRIVDRIEYLFAKLDEAKEKAQSVLDSFETCKAAILHKAFTGELTAKWRAEHGENLSAWQALLLGDIGNWGSGGTPSRNKPEYFEGNIPWVKTGELNDGYIYQTEEAISEEAVNNSSAKKYPKGTVLIAMYGATIGKCAILGIEATTNQACACAVPDKDTYNRFLFYYLLSQKDEFIKLGKGGAQPNISQTVIKQYPIKRPTLNEQQEIVCILDSLFAKEQQAKEAAEAVLEKIDLLKKSILARAFRGELGTNDPVEEPALELLKSVL